MSGAARGPFPWRRARPGHRWPRGERSDGVGFLGIRERGVAFEDQRRRRRIAVRSQPTKGGAARARSMSRDRSSGIRSGGVSRSASARRCGGGSHWPSDRRPSCTRGESLRIADTPTVAAPSRGSRRSCSRRATVHGRPTLGAATCRRPARLRDAAQHVESHGGIVGINEDAHKRD